MSSSAFQVLYDAFFKHQRKPKMTNLGELYYEGKEYEAKLEHLRPGVLSQELREALAMTDSSPPPWLVNMQVGSVLLAIRLEWQAMPGLVAVQRVRFWVFQALTKISRHPAACLTRSLVVAVACK
eukprot:GHUV01025614.1.p1 GENE.GHUV01025614.1~~GHUV01025614.1.p1  ORF type:complete len:125 (+),score=24.69 GHUV01025614.1:792-1166(+)